MNLIYPVCEMHVFSGQVHLRLMEGGNARKSYELTFT